MFSDPGLPLSVLQKAAKKSNDFENDNQKGHPAIERVISHDKENEETTLIEELLSVVEAWNLRRDSQAVNSSLLSNIQQRARSLAPCT